MLYNYNIYKLRAGDAAGVAGGGFIMVKIPRFFIEYKNYYLLSIKNNEYTKKYYNLCVAVADHLTHVLQRGMITTEEAMQAIPKILSIAIDKL